MSKMLTPSEVDRVVEILDPKETEYGVTYQIHPENNLRKCGVFVPSLIDTVQHLAHALFDHHTGDISNVPDPVIKAWLEWASKHKGELE